MKGFGGTAKIKSITKAWRTRDLSKVKPPVCNVFLTTTHKRFGTTIVAIQQLLTDCPSRLTRFSIQYNCRPSQKMQTRTLFAAMIQGCQMKISIKSQKC